MDSIKKYIYSYLGDERSLSKIAKHIFRKTLKLDIKVLTNKSFKKTKLQGITEFIALKYRSIRHCGY
jgi:hypothetical protein